MGKHKRCCLCGKQFCGYGNNSSPIKDGGVICDKCNNEKIIPVRIALSKIINKDK